MDRADRDRGIAAVPETAKPSRGEDGATSLDQDDGGEAVRPAHARRWRGLLAVAAIGLSVVVAPLALAVGITLTTTPLGPGDARVVTAAELEQEYGIKVSLVAVIAAGGVVDVRFTVLDKDKAGHLLHDAASLPELYVETSGAVLRSSRAKAHKMTVLDGASYFLLYPNSGGAIQAGTGVSVVIDAIRLEPIAAQS